jgi:hypothetical protein
MPDQSDQSQKPAGTPTTQPPTVDPPVISPQVDLPPLPPDFQNVAPEPLTGEPPKEMPDSTGSAAPPDAGIPPLGPNSSIAKVGKKFGGGRLIATILGVIILVGGVTTGVIVTQQRQLLEQQAAGEACGSAPDVCPGCAEECYDKNDGDTCTGGNGTCKLNGDGEGCYCDTGGNNDTACVTTCTNDLPPTTLRCGDCGGFCITSNCPSTCSQVALNLCGSNTIGTCPTGQVNCYYCPGVTTMQACNSTADSLPAGVGYDETSCSIVGSFCGVVQCDQVNSNPLVFQSRLDTSTCGATPPSSSPSPTPTAPSCISVKAYSATWTELTQTNLAALTAGTVVNFCVSGANGTFDKAQFKINSTAGSEVTAHDRPGSTTDFCQSYTILVADTTITVLAKIHDSVSNTWVGASF